MTAKEWNAGDVTRFYLSRTNAARTGAGYVEFFLGSDGKRKMKLVVTAAGPGSRTAGAEAESVYARYKAIRAEIAAAKAI